MSNNSMKYDLSKQVFMVTGAGSGIGAATAEQLNQAGAHVILVGRTLSKLSRVISEMSKPRMAEAFVADVSRENEVAELMAYIEKHYGRLDGAFNNAGTFGEFELLENDTVDNFDQVVSINLKGVWACMKYQLPLMARSGGAIVNCSSVAGHQGHVKSPVYSATKHAIIGLSKSTALQYAQQAVRVNVISPGSTDTPILRSLYADTQTFNQRAQRAPMGRVGEPSEVAQAVVWLLSAQSSYVNGQTLLVDGGVMAGNPAMKEKHHVSLKEEASDAREQKDSAIASDDHVNTPDDSSKSCGSSSVPADNSHDALDNSRNWPLDNSCHSSLEALNAKA